MAKAKKTQKAAEPRIMNGHLVKEAKAPLYKVKHAKGDKPYQLSDKKIKVTLVKSTIGCLKVQQRTDSKRFALLKFSTTTTPFAA